MKYSFTAIFFLPIFIISCSSVKLIPKGSKFFKVDEQNTGGGLSYTIVEETAKSCFKAKITEGTDIITIVPIKPPKLSSVNQLALDPSKVNPYLSLANQYYYPNNANPTLNAKSLKYYDIKFGLQALTIPLKFRKAGRNDSINPASVETGVNVGFAPGWKFTKNIFKPSKNYLGKNVTQIAFAIGPHFGLGSTSLKKATNAPTIKSDRTRPIFTTGVFAMIGFNNINVGVAFGNDYILGSGHSDWIYQGKTWTGVIVSLDILKY